MGLFFFPTWPLRVGSPPPDGRAQGARACARMNRVLFGALQACFRHVLQSAWRFARSPAPRTRLWPFDCVRQVSQFAYGPRQGACALPCFTFAAEHAAPCDEPRADAPSRTYNERARAE